MSRMRWCNSGIVARGRERRFIEKAQPAREQVRNKRGENETDAQRQRQRPYDKQRLCDLFKRQPIANDLQAQASESQHNSGLDREEYPAYRSVHSAQTRLCRDRRGFQEMPARGSLDIGEQFLVRSEAVEQFGVHFTLDLRYA